MGDEQTWRRVLDIIGQYKKPFIVVSATARTTRQLLAAANKALHNLEEAQEMARAIQNRHREIISNFLNHFPQTEDSFAKASNQRIDTIIFQLKKYLFQINDSQQLNNRVKDAIASIGEQLSSYLFAQCGRVYGLPTRWIDATDVIRTDSNFGQASPNTGFIDQQAQELLKIVNMGYIPVMGGFYGQDAHGNLTTLGFEGSDYTASLMGAAFNARAIEVWTDVSGIYTCDPRLVPQAKPIAELSFQEATELAYFGAKVLHPSTTKPASNLNIPIKVKNIFAPEQNGTHISTHSRPDGRAKAITFKEESTILTITSSATVMGHEFITGVFQTLQQHHISVDVVITTEASVSIALGDNKTLEKVVQDLREFGSVEITSGQALISLIGCRRNQITSLMNDVLAAVDSDTINLISFTRLKRNLNIVIDQALVENSVKAIHQRIFE